MQGGLCRFVLSFALGAGPVPCLLMSEILPGKIRAKAMAICLAVHWVIVFSFIDIWCFLMRSLIGEWATRIYPRYRCLVLVIRGVLRF